MDVEQSDAALVTERDCVSLLFFFFKCLAMTLATWAALHLNGMHLLCSCAQYPAELRTPGCSLTLPDTAIRGTWLAVAVSSSAVGTRIQLCLTRYHGNPCGQKLVLSP